MEEPQARETAALEAHDTLKAKVAHVYELLVATYGMPAWEPDGDALGGLIATVLSQHTSDTNSARAYARLIEAFPTWEQVRDAPVAAVEEAIRPGGLARQKARRIQEILRELTAQLKGGTLTLDGIADLPMDEAIRYLVTLPGVGPKTAACVLLFSLGKPAFPVDTHVYRVTQRLGLIGPKATAESAHEELTELIPPIWRHTMHVDLISHGRRTCYARNPACFRCPLTGECLYYWQVVAAGR